MTKHDTHRRLVNWGRYWRDFDGDFKRCLSLESKYIDHRSLDSRLAAEAEQEQAASRPPAPEMFDAITVNEAWKRCSKYSQNVLKYSFCWGRVDDEFVSQRCGIRIETLPLRFANAVREIARMLDEPAIRPIIRANNSRTSPDKGHPADVAETVAPSAPNSTVAALLKKTK